MACGTEGRWLRPHAAHSSLSAQALGSHRDSTHSQGTAPQSYFTADIRAGFQLLCPSMAALPWLPQVLMLVATTLSIQPYTTQAMSWKLCDDAGGSIRCALYLACDVCLCPLYLACDVCLSLSVRLPRAMLPVLRILTHA